MDRKEVISKRKKKIRSEKNLTGLRQRRMLAELSMKSKVNG